MNPIPRPEYPRPQFARESWQNLNGLWSFEFDDENIGCIRKWYLDHDFTRTILVPYVFQSELSGIHAREVHDVVWYAREFLLSENLEGKRQLLHFGAVDYTADIWVNGRHTTTHRGGHSSFEVDITDLVQSGTNRITIRVEDIHSDLELPRGKQYWKTQSESIFYTPSTGIWQTVWLETVAKSYLKRVWITPDLDVESVRFEFEVDGCAEVEIETTISFQGRRITKDRVLVLDHSARRDIAIPLDSEHGCNFRDAFAWSPDHPRLFEIEFSLLVAGLAVDQVSSYFAFRKISIVDGRLMLNNQDYYQRLLLDQGYWESSLLTAPTDEDFVHDIEMCKRMGFNGVRKHQKVEDPRFLYWADRLGLLVWGEAPNAYRYSRKYAARFVDEWVQILQRDYNHPCIVVWTPLNESWGVDRIMNRREEQSHSDSLYHLTKSMDITRLVIGNDGWEHTTTDLFTIHDYAFDSNELAERYSERLKAVSCIRGGRLMLAQGYRDEGQPILLTEIGGISFKVGSDDGWGYSQASSPKDFIRRYGEIVSTILESKLVQGFCYTQLTDVEQEINGLLTYGRVPKVDPDEIRKINEGQRT